MKKTIMIWSVLALFAGSCTDDKDDVVIPPDLPDNDMNISIPDNSGSEEWVPGKRSGCRSECVGDRCRRTWTEYPVRVAQ